MPYSSYTDKQLEHSVECLILGEWGGGQGIDKEGKQNVKGVKGHADDLTSSVSGASHEPRNLKFSRTRRTYFKKEF